MIAQIPPIYTNTSGSVNQTSQISSGTGTTLSNQDFSRILLEQMSSPNLDTLFGNTQETNNSIFGAGNLTSQFFGTSSTNNLLSNLLGQNLSGGLEMSIWSNLIGKTVTVVNSDTQAYVSGKVESITLQNGEPMLVLDNGTAVSPNNLVEIK